MSVGKIDKGNVSTIKNMSVDNLFIFLEEALSLYFPHKKKINKCSSMRVEKSLQSLVQHIYKIENKRKIDSSSQHLQFFVGNTV